MAGIFSASGENAMVLSPSPEVEPSAAWVVAGAAGGQQGEAAGGEADEGRSAALGGCLHAVSPDLEAPGRRLGLITGNT